MSEIAWIMIAFYGSAFIGVRAVLRAMINEDIILALAGFCHCAIAGYAFGTIIGKLVP